MSNVSHCAPAASRAASATFSALSAVLPARMLPLIPRIRELTFEAYPRGDAGANPCRRRVRRYPHGVKPASERPQARGAASSPLESHRRRSGHPGLRVTVVGSCMMDVVVEVARLPEPGETLVGSSVSTHVGGKGNNQAIAAARLGADVSLIGKVGTDAFGDQIRTYSEAAGVDCRGLLRDETVSTGVAVPIVLPDGNNSILAVPQANLALTPTEVDSSAGLITAAGLLLLQLEVGIEATLAAAEIANRAKVPIVLNTAPMVPHPPALRSLADVIVANETEADALCPGIAVRVAIVRPVQAKRAMLRGPISTSARRRSIRVRTKSRRISSPKRSWDSSHGFRPHGRTNHVPRQRRAVSRCGVRL